MKKTILALCIIFIGFNCFAQVHKEKYIPKKKVNYCILPIVLDSATVGIGYAYGCCTTYIKDGVTCVDSTGMAAFYRQKYIGDTTYLWTRYDTTRVLLLTEVDRIKLHTQALKVTDNSMYMTSDLYEDTLTKKHFMGNSAMGQGSVNEVRPSIYLQMSRETFPANVYIYGEIKN